MVDLHDVGPRAESRIAPTGTPAATRAEQSVPNAWPALVQRTRAIQKTATSTELDPPGQCARYAVRQRSKRCTCHLDDVPRPTTCPKQPQQPCFPHRRRELE